MTPGEVSSITSTSQYAYDGRPDRPAGVPQGAQVKWEVELISFEKQQDWERAEPDVKIERAGMSALHHNRHMLHSLTPALSMVRPLQVRQQTRQLCAHGHQAGWVYAMKLCGKARKSEQLYSSVGCCGLQGS